jgi:hypothetical protein
MDFLEKAHANIVPGGMLYVKENVDDNGFYVDKEDSDFDIAYFSNRFLRLQTAGEAESEQETDEYVSSFVH